jgi:hypothetical protein
MVMMVKHIGNILHHIANSLHARDMFLFQSSPSKLLRVLCLDSRLNQHMVKVTGGFYQVILSKVSPILWDICHFFAH